MHTATQLSADMFHIVIDGRPASIGDLLSPWSADSRLGVVVRQPLGALGASLLIQSAIVASYDAEPSRRANSRYPEIFLIHVGERFGDHSPLDFWPPRKEIFAGAEPDEVLAAINNCAITHLAVPEGAAHALDHPYSEAEAAAERLRAAWCYAECGRAPDSDVTIAVEEAAAIENVRWTIEPDGLLRQMEEAAGKQKDPAMVRELARYIDALRKRRFEVTDEARKRMVRLRAALRTRDAEATEAYRRISSTEALAHL